MDRLTCDTNGKSGVGLTFDLNVECPNMDEAIKLQRLLFRLGLLESAVADENKNYDLDRLHKLAEADREERAVLLPCKDWMKIVFGYDGPYFAIQDGEVREITVDPECRISIYGIDEFGIGAVSIEGRDENGDYFEFYPEDVGDTVFLTPEEAQAALEKEKKYDR